MVVMRISGVLCVCAALSACAGSDGLRQLNTKFDGPDEFKILPVKPLQEPQSYTNLPVPTPGGANLSDPTPTSDALIALGGRPQKSTSTKIPSSDAALVTQASRYGVTPQIRQELAAADEEFRKRRGRWTQLKIIPVDRYQQVYEGEALDPFIEADRFRKLGIATPAAPPENE